MDVDAMMIFAWRASYAEGKFNAMLFVARWSDGAAMSVGAAVGPGWMFECKTA